MRQTAFISNHKVFEHVKRRKRKNVYLSALAGHQSGLVLLVCLVLLALMAILGVAILRDSSLENKISGNSIDQARTREAAEIAVREAEVWIQEQMVLPPIVSEFFPASSQLSIAQNNNAQVTPGSVILRDEVLDVSNVDHWQFNGRVSANMNTILGVDVNDPPSFIVSANGIDAISSGARDDIQDVNNNAANPTIGGAANNSRQFSSFVSNNLNLGQVADASGRFIFLVQGRARGGQAGATVIVESTFARPYNTN